MNKFKHIIQKIGQGIFVTGAVCFVLSIFMVFLISLPPVQNRLVRTARLWLESQTKSEVFIERVQLGLPAAAVLQNVQIYDQKGEPMLNLRQFRLNMLTFSLWRYFLKKEDVQTLQVNHITLVEPNVRLYKFQQDSLTHLNLDFFLDVFNAKADSGTPTQKTRFDINLSEIEIRQGTLSWIDSTSTEIDSVYEDRLNFSNLFLEDIDGIIGVTFSSSDRLHLRVDDLNLVDQSSQFELKQLRLDLLSDTLRRSAPPNEEEIISFIQIKNLFAYTDQTLLRANIFLPNETLTQLLDKELKEEWEIDLKKSTIDAKTVNYFIPSPLPVSGVLSAQGQISGDINQLFCPDFKAWYEDYTYLESSWTIRHLTHPDSLFMDIRFQNSQFDFSEIASLLPDLSLPESLLRIDSLQAKGRFLGHYDDFDLNAQTTSELGQLESDIHVKLPPLVKDIQYVGVVSSQNFDLNSLTSLSFSPSGNLTMRAQINGKGDDLNRVNLVCQATVSPSDIMGFPVDTSSIDIKIENKKLTGKVLLEDQEGRANLDLDLDMSSRSTYKIKGEVSKLNLATYKIYQKQPLWFSADLNVDLSGDSLDNTLGEVRIANARLNRIGDTTEFKVNDFYLQTDTSSLSCNPFSDIPSSTKNEGTLNTYYNLKSSLLDAYICGNFTLKKGLALTQRLITESGMYLANDDSLIQTYYENKIRDTIDVNAVYSITSKKGINEIFRFLETPIYISPLNTMSGRLHFAKVDQASLELKLDSAHYHSTKLKHINLTLGIDKFSDQNYLLTYGNIKADSVQLIPGFDLQDVILELDGEDRKLGTYISASQIDGDKKNRLQTVITSDFFPDGRISTYIDSLASVLTIGNSNWNFSKKNEIRLTDEGAVELHDLRLSSGAKFVGVSGEVARQEDSRLRLKINKLELKNLQDIINLPYQFNGVLTAEFKLDDLLGTPEITGKGDIGGFGLDDFIYGDVLANMNWDHPTETLRLHAHMIDKGLQDTTLSLSGHYYGKKEEPLAFQVSTSQPFPLNYIYPFVKSQLYGITGNVELTSFTIGGNFDDLDIRGKGEFADAGFGVDYFKTEYKFDGLIEFDKNIILFPKKNGLSAIRLFDREGHRADFYGAILHNGMREFEFDLQLDKISNFLVMDTKKKDNELFYGKIYVKNGVASITGDLEKLEVQAEMMSGAGSQLKIPVSFDTQLQKPEFIKFKGEVEEEQDGRSTGLQGFELNLTVQATEESQVDLIFDERVGDIIQGRGEGSINLRINEAGDFSMFGDYEVRQGNYLFTARNIINKKFEVESGGRISWDGDPYNAKLDLDAVYPLYADIKDLLQVEKTIRVPVSVLMHLEGSLLKPEISLAIDLPNLKEQDALEIVSYLKSIKYDEQELNKQVFSLMLFNRFAPVGGFLGDQVANTGVTTSISEMLSNQLNYWLSRAIDENISVSVGTSNFQDVDLLVSAKLFNDRVTIERDGTLVNSNQTSPTVGNVNIIIKLLPGERDIPQETNRRPSELVLEVFNRERIGIGTTTIKNQTGIGIFYKKDFDNLRDLLTKIGKN